MSETREQNRERWSYDVFLSFRGEDVRNNFLSHLYERLVRSGINTFKDDEELERGENISPELLKAIGNSKILLVVLSKNYASSSWCLDELLHIMECRKSDSKHMVLPVFYNVDPADVRKQKGSFGESLDKHNSHPESKLQQWKTALTEVANLAGFHSLGCRNEADLIDHVVRKILQRLPSSPLQLPTYAVGIRSRVDRINELMCFRSNAVQIIGICGMGGIGKTTLAKAAYNEFSHRFEGTSFVENFGESFKSEGKIHLQRQFLSDILKIKDIEVKDMDHEMKKRFCNKRVFVVLDDVEDMKQLNSTAIDFGCFGPGSRILITCRNTHLLGQLGVENIYSPEKLDDGESLNLLSLHAFRTSVPPEAFEQLSGKLVDYCGGLPLAMEVLGAFLFKRSISTWESTIEVLKQTPNADIQAKLQISFDALNPVEKDQFLDISCFFIGMDKDYVGSILNGCDVLVERCLITVLDNKLMMHDLLRDMGRQIVQGTSRNKCERSRLWDLDDVIDVLANNSGTDAIEGLSLKAGLTDDKNLKVKAFSNLQNLRLLQLSHVKLKGSYAHFPRRLQWLFWFKFPLDSLPTKFHLGSLVAMELQYSNLKRLWDDKEVKCIRQYCNLKGLWDNKKPQYLKMLKYLDLSHSVQLTKTPDFSFLPNLEMLRMIGCRGLVLVHKSIGTLHKTLVLVNLKGCTKLGDLPLELYALKALKTLILSDCSKLERLDDALGTLTSLEKLYLDDTPLKILPSSIGYLKNLQELHLRHCTSLFQIPDTINELISLKELFINCSSVTELPLKPGSLPWLADFSAGGCFELHKVPSSIGGLNSLLQLQLDMTRIATLPKEIGNLHCIRKLELRHCKFLYFLPHSIGYMNTLHSLHLEGSNIVELPEEFGKLENLVLLRMSDCRKLKRLPESFGDLKSLHHLFMEETLVAELPESFGNLSNLRVLKMCKPPHFRRRESDSSSTSKEPCFVEVPSSLSNLLLLEELEASSWRIWGKIPDVLERLSAVKILNLGNNYFHSLPSSLEGLSNLQELSLYDCRELECLPPLPWKLEKLNLGNCFALENISDLSKLEILHELNLTNCEKVADIPGLEHLTALERLYMSGCNSTCSLSAKKILSKVSLKMMRFLSLPGNRIPVWFSQGPVKFSAQPNRELRGVIIAVVVALDHETGDYYPPPDVLDVQAQILRRGPGLDTYTLRLHGVPITKDDQLYICRYSVLHPMFSKLKDKCTLQVIKRKPPFKQGVDLKMHGIHLVYEGDDDVEGKEHLLAEAQLTISQKFNNFFGSFEGEVS